MQPRTGRTKMEAGSLGSGQLVWSRWQGLVRTQALAAQRGARRREVVGGGQQLLLGGGRCFVQAADVRKVVGVSAWNYVSHHSECSRASQPVVQTVDDEERTGLPRRTQPAVVTTLRLDTWWCHAAAVYLLAHLIYTRACQKQQHDCSSYHIAATQGSI